ncbi:cold-shock protein [Cupriavidus sp. SK-3]|uniref:cold-shock protein n=1 Tax=Cupriavidus sp. SK-3 TaxID=1470558 RepID=UPI001F487A1D|nr:cold shock domain-containing protein [Cupriavidus sp. SK-3]
MTPDGGGADLFAHHTEIQGTGYRSLDEGAKVEFESRQGPKGLQASQIRKL